MCILPSCSNIFSYKSKKVSDFCKRSNMVLFSLPRLLQSVVAMMLFSLLVIMIFTHMKEIREPMLQEGGIDQSGAGRGLWGSENARFKKNSPKESECMVI